MGNANFLKGDKIKFNIGCDSSTFSTSSNNIYAKKGDRGTILEDNGVNLKIMLETGKHIYVPVNAAFTYLMHDMSLMGTLVENKSNKGRVKRNLDKSGKSLEKLSKLVQRKWSPIKKRELERKIESEIKSLKSLSKVLKGMEWEDE